MALFNECMPSCAHTVLDTADIVRDGDLSLIDTVGLEILHPKLLGAGQFRNPH